MACTAAQCLVILMEMFPQDAAAGILSGDGLLMLADALQPSQGSPADEGTSASSASQDTGEEGFAGREVADADCARQQQLLTCLAAACQFQPPVNIMAGMYSVWCEGCDMSTGFCVSVCIYYMLHTYIYTICYILYVRYHHV